MRARGRLSVVVALTLAAGFAFAQTGDAVADGNGHPNVGALLMPRADGSLRIICSGTLVTPRVLSVPKFGSKVTYDLVNPFASSNDVQ